MRTKLSLTMINMRSSFSFFEKEFHLITSGCNSTQSEKSEYEIRSSAFLGRSLTATLTLPEPVVNAKKIFIWRSLNPILRTNPIK